MRYVEACEHGHWHLELVKLEDGEYIQVPYRCRSWRHAGECLAWKTAQDFCRIRDALKTRRDWVFATLTHNQSTWKNWKDQYTESGRMFACLKHRLQYRYGKIAYVQTWERHRKVGIHAHNVFGNAGLAEDVERNVKKWKAEVFEPLAVACGFGYVSHVKPMERGTDEGMAGYLVKKAKELIGGGEKDQIPWDAPAHFRRLRASRGLLPPPDKSEGWTGRLCFSSLEEARLYTDGKVEEAESLERSVAVLELGGEDVKAFRAIGGGGES